MPVRRSPLQIKFAIFKIATAKVTPLRNQLVYPAMNSNMLMKERVRETVFKIPFVLTDRNLRVASLKTRKK